MPLGDRTGPWGLGPMTGRAAGYCAGWGVPGYMNPIPGWGRGFGGWGRGFWGRGRGRGWRHWYYATGLPGWARAPLWWGYGSPASPATPWTGPAQADPKAEQRFLRQQAEALQAELDAVRRRLSDLEREAGAATQ